MDESAYTSTLFHPVRRGQGVRERRWFFCAAVVLDMPTSELIRSCAYCGQFYARCCKQRPLDDDEFPCHHLPVVYTDGACRNNGRAGAVQQAGLGIAMGASESDQWAVPVDDSVDPGGPRTSQRAELLAAIRGVELWTRHWRSREASGHGQDHVEADQLIIATDSEYVCKGVYEWYPRWQSNGWRGSSGVPKNLDLFHKLDEVVTVLESLGVKVGFLHLRREYNTIADGLAKKAAAEAQAPSEITHSMGALLIVD